MRSTSPRPSRFSFFIPRENPGLRSTRTLSRARGTGEVHRRKFAMNPVPPVSLWPDPQALGPLTDLYQLTMMAGYVASGHANDRATFEMFVRRLPKGRSYLVFAGVEQAIGDLMRLRF